MQRAESLDADKPVALVVEDDAFSNVMLTSFMQTLGYHVLSAHAGAHAIALLRTCDPDVVLLDLDLGEGPTGVDVLEEINQRFPWTAVVMLSSHRSPQMVSSRSIARCAFFTYLVKSELTTPQDLRQAIERALDGEGANLPQSTASCELTAAQAEILRYIAKGMSNEEIARQKSVRPSSVERMIARLYRELGLPQGARVNQRVEAARRYFEGDISIK